MNIRKINEAAVMTDEEFDQRCKELALEMGLTLNEIEASQALINCLMKNRVPPLRGNLVLEFTHKCGLMAAEAWGKKDD
jgi:hypothetical protein